VVIRRELLAAGLGATGLAACRDALPAVASSSATTGLDPALLAQTLETAATLPKLHAIIVARDGVVQAERVYRGPALETPVNIKSASKSVLAGIAGMAIGRGVLAGPDQLIAPFLGDRFPADPDPRLAMLTVGHLLSMQAGLASTSGANYGAWVSSPNWVRYALAQPFEAEPGGRMIYSTGTSHLLSAVLTRAADMSTLALARETLGAALTSRFRPGPPIRRGSISGATTCGCRRAPCWRSASSIATTVCTAARGLSPRVGWKRHGAGGEPRAGAATPMDTAGGSGAAARTTSSSPGATAAR
jgi:CubicO group peptidase (beta-lactamase class C family)